MKCPECKGRGHFLMPMSTPKCDTCSGSGEVADHLYVSTKEGFEDAFGGKVRAFTDLYGAAGVGLDDYLGVDLALSHKHVPTPYSGLNRELGGGWRQGGLTFIVGEATDILASGQQLGSPDFYHGTWWSPTGRRPSGAPTWTVFDPNWDVQEARDFAMQEDVALVAFILKRHWKKSPNYMRVADAVLQLNMGGTMLTVLKTKLGQPGATVML